VAVQTVLREDVPLAEGHLDAVGRGVGEIVGDEEVAVAAEGGEFLRDLFRDLEQIVDVAPVVLAAEALTLAVQPVLADGLQAGEAEEAVAAVRDGVLGEDVVVALLEAEDAGRVLAAVVNALDVPADAE